MIKTIDLTGNWYEPPARLPYVQTCEPPLFEGEKRYVYSQSGQKPSFEGRDPIDVRTGRFRQELSLPEGSYTLKLAYEPRLDRRAGQAVSDAYDTFDGLSVNGQTLPLAFSPTDDGSYIATADFHVLQDKALTDLELTLASTRVMRTWLSWSHDMPPSPAWRAVAPDGPGELVLAHGIPFHASRLEFRHPGGLWAEECSGLRRWQDGLELDCGGACVKTAHFLGMIHSIDIANGSWYTPRGDHGYSHFVGDVAGWIIVTTTDGSEVRVPLMFGFNLWYSTPWDIHWYFLPEGDGPGGGNLNDELFGGDKAWHEVIHDGLKLVDGVRLMGKQTCNARFIFSLDLAEMPVESIRIIGTDQMHGHPLISAVTLETSDQPGELAPLPQLGSPQPAVQPVSLDTIRKRGYERGVERIKRLLYAFIDDLPKLSEPEIPDGCFGPAYDFRGADVAVYAATFLYRNGPECAAYIADSGTGCSSSTARKALTYYTLRMGVWRTITPVFESYQNWVRLYRDRDPGDLPGIGNMWTRGAGQLIRETMAFGYDKFVDSYVNWLDRCLFEDGNPPHWVRIAGLGTRSPEYEVRQVGDVEERGNRENDSHGLCMCGRYMAWHWKGRDRDWNERHFDATAAAVDWIRFQLDTDTIYPGVRKDVLFSNTECAHNSYDIFSTYNCLHGVKLSIRMAEQLGRDDLATEWRRLYERLCRGVIEHLVDSTDEGPVWHTEDDANWQDHAHKLVHLHVATEGDSFTPLQDYAAGDEIDQRFLEISRNTYKVLMKDCDYNCLRMYGYGQGMMLQSALLMDEMADAERFLDLMVRYCYLPHLEGWTCPEGIIMHRSGRYYVPVNGYTGQDSHVADSVKALRVMLGVDDNDPQHLRLVPRFPTDWTHAAIRDFPVLTGNRRQKLGYEYRREPDRHTFEFFSDYPVEQTAIRLGPVPDGAQIADATVDGTAVPFEELSSGDSRWVWVNLETCDHANVEVRF